MASALDGDGKRWKMPEEWKEVSVNVNAQSKYNFVFKIVLRHGGG